MGYVDAFDLAREREEAARKEQNKAQAERRAELNERDERGRALFRNPLEDKLNEAVRVDLEAQQGYVNPHERAAAQEQTREAIRPYWDEWRQVYGSDMPVEVQSEILAGLRRGKLSDERVEMLRDTAVATRTQVYETLPDQKATLAQANAFVAQKLPKLNALFKETGAGNSVPLARFFMSQVKERALATERGATAARPFASLLKR